MPTTGTSTDTEDTSRIETDLAVAGERVGVYHSIATSTPALWQQLPMHNPTTSHAVMGPDNRAHEFRQLLEAVSCLSAQSRPEYEQMLANFQMETGTVLSHHEVACLQTAFSQPSEVMSTTAVGNDSPEDFGIELIESGFAEDDHTDVENSAAREVEEVPPGGSPMRY